MHARSFAALSLVCFAASAAAQGYFSTGGQVVAATNDQVPGLATGVIYNDPNTPVMDLNGNLLFVATLNGPGTNTLNNRVLLYGRTKDDLQVIAQSGGPEPTGTMPGVNLYRYISATTPQANTITSAYRISPTGSILWWGAGLDGGGIVHTGTGATGRNDSAFFWGPPGGQLVLCQRGQQAPTGGSFLDTAFSTMSNQPTAMNASGTCAFQVALVGGDVVTTPVSNAAAWLIGIPGSLQFMLRRGDIVNVAGGTATIGTLGFGLQMVETGHVLHDEKLSTTAGTTTGSATVTTATDGLLMLYSPGTGNSILAREGDPAPGTVGASFNALTAGTVGLTRSLGVCFYTTLIGGDVVGTTNDSAIYRSDVLGNHTMVIRRGDVLPSGETVATIMNSSISMNDAGTVTFFAVLTGPSITSANDQVLITGTTGNWTIVAQEGNPAPGVAGGVLGPVQPGFATMNDLGQIVFNVDITAGATFGGASIAYEPAAGLKLLDFAGDVYTTVSGTQTSTGVSGGIQFNSGDGSPMTLNNNGDVVRRISSGNGIGVAVRGMLGGLNATPATIPAIGGTQTWSADAGIANAGRLYVFAGTLSGTRPGFSQLGVQIPLNNDFWLPLSLAAANGAVYTNSWGLLDGNGRANASFNFPAGFGWMIGATFHHAFVVIDPSTVLGTFVSNPASLVLN